MAEVFEFPIERTRTRARIERLLQVAMEAHEPATRSRKLEVAMTMVDRHLSDEPDSVTIASPPGEPFTQLQIECMRAAMEEMRNKHMDSVRQLVLENILLNFAIIDAEPN